MNRNDPKEDIGVGDARESVGLQGWVEVDSWDDPLWLPEGVRFLLRKKFGRAGDCYCELLTLEGWTVFAWVKNIRVQSKALV